MRGRSIARRLTAALAACALLGMARADEGPTGAYASARQVGALEHEALSEASGLARGGPHNPEILWAHNDSGDRARVFALDLAGQDRGVWTVRGVEARDCEDVSSYTVDGESWLLLADTGDNDRERPHVTLYMVREPQVAATPAGGALKLERALRFRYPGGARDCEAVAVDGPGRRILLVTKDRGDGTAVFALPLSGHAGAGVLAATPLGRLDLPKVTALDVSSDGRRAVVLTYTDAHLFERRGDEPWQAAFSRRPLRIELPKRRQGEAVCFAADGRTLYLTSEKRPAPLFEVPWIARPAVARPGEATAPASR